MILFLNPDTEVLKDSLKKAYYFLKENSEYGAVGCKILYPDGKIYHPCARGFPTPLRVFYHMFFFPKIFPNSKIFGAIDLKFWDKNLSRDVECLVGAFMMVKSEILSKIGAFREEYFMYGEDIDLCYRIVMAGFKIRYFSDCSIIHHTEKSSNQIKKGNFKTVMKAESNWLFHKFNYGVFYGSLYRLALLSGSIFRLIVSMIIATYFIIRNKRKKYYFVKNLINEQLSIVKWAFGFERWVKKYIKM